MRQRFVTHHTAEAHEALVARLARLLKQAEAIAVRRPEEGVPRAVGALAADLLFEAARFGPSAAHPAIPMAAPSYAGLAAQLGQAMAVLEDFEARHTQWDARLGAFVWRFGAKRGEPVARLRQEIADPAPAPVVQRNMPQIRAELAWRMARQRSS